MMSEDEPEEGSLPEEAAQEDQEPQRGLFPNFSRAVSLAAAEQRRLGSQAVILTAERGDPFFGIIDRDTFG